MIFYYKLIKEDDNTELGFINSLNFRYYNEKSKKILCCTEEKAQYVAFNNQYYRVNSFKEASKSFKKEFPDVIVLLASQEEYEKYIAEQEEAKSDEK
jgi:hypothetical protein